MLVTNRDLSGYESTLEFKVFNQTSGQQLLLAYVDIRVLERPSFVSTIEPISFELGFDQLIE